LTTRIGLITAILLIWTSAPRTQDRLGDPLPEGALLRLGTARLRVGVFDLCYLPDGRGVLAPGDHVEIWDLAKGERQRRIRVTKGGIASVVAHGDGKTLLIAGRSGTVREWDIERQEALRSWDTGQSGLCAADYSPDGTRVLTTGATPPTLKEWDLYSGEERVFINGAMHGFRAGIYGPGGRTALAAGGTGRHPILAHYDLSDGRLLNEWFEDYTAYSKTIELSHDGTRLLVGSRHGASEWLLDGYRQIGEYRGHHGSAVTSLAYCVNPDQILTGSRDGSIRRWDRKDEKVLLRWVPHAGHVRRMAVSPDGKWVLSYGHGMVAETSLETGRSRLQWDRHEQAVQAIAFAPDGRQVVSGSSDGTLRIWDVRTGVSRLKIDGARLGAYAVAISPDGARIAVGCKDGIVREYRREDGARVRELRGHLGYVRSVAYTPDGARLLTSADDGSVRARSDTSQNPVAAFEGHQGGVLTLSVSPDGRRLLTGGRDGTVRLWDLASADLVRTLRGHRSWVEAVAFCGSDSIALSTGVDSRLIQWDLKTGRVTSEMSHKRPIHALVYDHATSIIFTGGDSRGLACWDPTYAVWSVSGRVTPAPSGRSRSPPTAASSSAARMTQRSWSGTHSPSSTHQTILVCSGKGLEACRRDAQGEADPPSGSAPPSALRIERAPSPSGRPTSMPSRRQEETPCSFRPPDPRAWPATSSIG
jgi:WD40 repeat protein